LAKAGREGKALDPVRNKFDKYDNTEVDEGIYQGGPDKSQIPAVNRPGNKLTTADLEKERTQSPTSAEGMRALQDKLSKINPMDETDMEEGNRFSKAVVDAKADGIQPGEKINVGGKEYPVKEAAGAVDFDKVLDAIAAMYGDDMWQNDAMQDLANDLAQAGPTDRELDFIIANGRLPKRLANTQFSAGDNVQFGEAGLPMVKGPDGKMVPKFAADGEGPNDLKKSFADKIAGAKQEVDEMLGDVAAEAMKSAIGKMKMTDEGNDFTGARLAAIRAGKPTFKVGGKTYRVSGDTSDEKAMVEADKEDLSPFTNYKKSRADRPKVGSTEHGALHDIEHTATGRKVTRRVDPNTGHSVGADDDTPGEKRGRGRPGGKGAGKSIGAKGPSGKSKLMTREGPDDIQDQGEYDQEGDMAKDDIKTIMRHAQALSKVLGDNDNLPEWVQSKLAKIEGMMISIDEYMQNQEGDNSEEEPIAEKAVSKQQQKFMGMAHAMQKGEKIKGASKELKKVAKTMKPKDAEDFASTKHKGLPNKVKEESTNKEDQKAERAGKRVANNIEHDEGHKGRDDNRAEKAGKKVTKDIEYDDKKDRKEKKKDEVEENTVAGSVAPAMGGKASKGSGGMTFGKGVYEGAIAESFNSKLNAILNEGMSVNMSADQDGKKSLTVTATDDDAVKLSQLLNLAGIGGQNQGYGEVCPNCGSSDCGCDHVEEDLANSADNTVYADTDYMVNGITAGLNGRKTDQSTLPVPNRDPRRTIGSVDESNDVVELYKRIS